MNNIKKFLPTPEGLGCRIPMPELPSSCCCGLVKIPTASRVFATFRLVIAILVLILTFEELIQFDHEKELELEFDEEFMANHGDKLEKIQADHHKQFLIVYCSLISTTIILGVVEVVMCSLQIHGARKKIVKFLFPYLIWTGILMTVFSLLFLVVFSVFLRKLGLGGIIMTLIMGGFLALNITDFIYALANYKQMRVKVGVDHVRLNEI